MEEKIDKILETLGRFDSKLSTLEEQQSHSSIRTQRIERALTGDKDYDQKGIVQDVNDIKKYIDKDKVDKAKQKGIVIGLGAASGGLMAWLKSLWG